MLFVGVVKKRYVTSHRLVIIARLDGTVRNALNAVTKPKGAGERENEKPE